ncbi:MAG: hypothetical protein CL406_08105 [Acidimicrobiaceae bacterium]|jgi:class 3 adenylate cyclase|nr:hypothetical protein [Acidimicrobiaceae bacterium]MDP6481805.1 adenylate/guanylate cyclase domain-containing protein [Acidimicrobiales bacterium]MDP6697882.1 adenylate/guanylate cyclase domain-containing protein [Acidimicrobiales bacterium]|tara:strand:+ start:6382 stop:6930 length:549 start_codon:yes stop_codon:yes gene_type:complete
MADMGQVAGSIGKRVDRTFAFIDLSGFTAFMDAEGDGPSVDVIIGFRAVVRRVAGDHGVRVAKYLGDGAMLVGVEPESLVETVVEIEACIDAAGSVLPLRAGIARGWVLLIEGEDHIGDAVNLASRLCDMAQPNEVLAPASMVSGLLVNTGHEALGPRRINGFAEPIDLVRLVSPDATRWRR